MGLPPGKCEKKGAFYVYPGLDLTSRMTQGDHDIWLRVAVADGGEAYASIEAKVDAGCKTSEQLIDTCGAFASNDKCRLQDEVVDGVTSFRNGVNTGLSPLPQTRLFGTGICATQITRDFFLRERATGARLTWDRRRNRISRAAPTSSIIRPRRCSLTGSKPPTTAIA
jgi:hypothetical protein